ncbi:unnamed protein product [Parnassius mnemosyne]|uniref:V-type proton ATPase subunit S1/VOA1 transmembrane domain-containing protein n=1 Tax=Parnassius mnemosyne TaxID=213953 RepID=A0AAV1LSW3_9NEOP
MGLVCIICNVLIQIIWLDNVVLLEGGEEVGRSELGVGAPWDWSYVCGEPLALFLIIRYNHSNEVGALTTMRIGRASSERTKAMRPAASQAPPPANTSPNPQPPADKGAPDTPKSFGKSVNCGPYFNSVILAELFVTFICLGVLACAVSAVYNCHSNDKYDDPQGKALTIAGEGTH